MLRTVINFEPGDLKDLTAIAKDIEPDSELARKLSLMFNTKQNSLQMTEEEIEHVIDLLPLGAKLRPQLVQALQWLRKPSRESRGSSI